MTRTYGAIVLATALITAQSALADSATERTNPPQAQALAPLAPGQAAGIRAAQNNGPDINKVAIVAGIGLAALAIYFIAGTHYHVPSGASAASGTH